MDTQWRNSTASKQTKATFGDREDMLPTLTWILTLLPGSSTIVRDMIQKGTAESAKEMRAMQEYGGRMANIWHLAHI